MNTLFYPNTLPERTAKLLEKIQLSNHAFLDSFYLSGGTALSLQLGHRESEDLDFFSEADFDPEMIRTRLKQIGELTDAETDINTLNADLDQVKIQFLGYPYSMLEPLIDYEGIKLSSVIDIGCTKLLTIGSRGSKKDFLDMFVILEKYTLEELVYKLGEKYTKTEYNFPHILKSLVYFVDADNQPMPRMHREIEWEQVKERMREVVKAACLT